MSDEIGLYIHVPFCTSKCRYCDFNSYAGKQHATHEYFESLAREMKLYGDGLKNRTVQTIFIGGGTPSCVDDKYIGEIMDNCRRYFDIDQNCEISIESNPGTLDIHKLKAYRNYGINRISIGLQAYQENLLKYLGRCHSTHDFIESIELAKRAGFSNINADVIFGIPGQTFDDWKETLKALVDLGITHISAYSLKIEEGTPFGDMLENGKLTPVDDDVDRDMYHYAVRYLSDRGFKHYELSNFSKDGNECRHNLIYWKCVEYLGLGAGAHSYLNSNRFSNLYEIEKYIEVLKNDQKPIWEQCTIDIDDKISEFMFLGLRLTKGVSNSEFKRTFKQDMFEKYDESFRNLRQKGLIDSDSEHVWLTKLGLDLANQVFVEFV